MSEYGRLFEEVKRIRVQLKTFRRVRHYADIYKEIEATRFKNPDGYSGDVTAERLIETNFLADAKKSVARLKGELDAMINSWEQLEKEMEKASDG